MITRVAEFCFQTRSAPLSANADEGCEVFAYLDANDFETARRRVTVALHRLGFALEDPVEGKFGHIHLTNWLWYRAKRLSHLVTDLPDQFELRNMLTAGEIFFIGLSGQKETFRYA